MELRPTPESWRVALLTAGGAGVIVALALFLLATQLSPWIGAFGGLGAIATFIPAVAFLTSSVEVDEHGVDVHRFGRVRHYAWQQVTGVRIVERRASVPDGTEYHWVFPGGESYASALPRAQRALAAARAADGSHVLVVSHEMIGRLLRMEALRLGVAEAMALDQPHSLVVELEPAGGHRDWMLTGG